MNTFGCILLSTLTPSPAPPPPRRRPGPRLPRGRGVAAPPSPPISAGQRRRRRSGGRRLRCEVWICFGSHRAAAASFYLRATFNIVVLLQTGEKRRRVSPYLPGNRRLCSEITDRQV